jgi:NADH-quinone oxidoreductase subunit C
MTQPSTHPATSQRPNAELADRLRRGITGIDLKLDETSTDVNITVPVAQLHGLVQALKERRELGFDMLRNISGIDFVEEGMALKYHLYSFGHKWSVQITVATSSGHPHIQTITDLYPAADWHEREAAEMFGFMFDGHPKPENLLLEQDLHIHPLLKAHPLQKVEILQGIEDGPAGFKF